MVVERSEADVVVVGVVVELLYPDLELLSLTLVVLFLGADLELAGSGFVDCA